MRADSAHMVNLAGRRRHFVSTKPHKPTLKGGYFR